MAAEIAAIAACEALDELDAPILRICALPAPHTFSPSVDAYLVPSVDRIVLEIETHDGEASMTVTIAMPQLGLTMTEATVGAWLKKPGDAVRKDEPLLSISTDKVDMDVESNVDGVLRDILVEEGQTVPVGTPLAHVDAVGKEPSAAAASPVLPNDVAKPASVVGGISAQRDKPLDKEEPSETLRSSPRARRLARQLGIDIAGVKGSGPQGRIVEKDLLNLAPVRSAAAGSQTDSKRRQLIAESMLESIRTIPPFSVSLEVNAAKACFPLSRPQRAYQPERRCQAHLH